MNQDNASNSNNQHQNSQATMQLTSPCGNYGIPVFYRRNSLAIRCQVCEVQAEDQEAKVCEIFVELPEDVVQVKLEEWSVLEGGMCACSRLFGCSGACVLHISRL